MTKPSTSPSGTGPAGAHFEAKVGGFYLLALLLDSEPRGLPGGRIESIQFQGAGEGFPLDDVIVYAAMATGEHAVAEIQVKRAISFSPGDAVFSKVASQIAEAVKADKLDDADEYVMAIATARTSWKIDGSYQEVLLWARDCEGADAFFRKLKRIGTSNVAMRTFVETLRNHVAEFSAPFDDATVWRILRKLQILVFDFLAVEGQTEALVRDRCAQALDTSERSKAGALWSVLCDIAQGLSTHAGQITADTLRTTLINIHGFKLAGLRRHDTARSVLFEASRHALNDIRDQVGEAKLSRHDRLAVVNASLDTGRYVEIRGDGGVGKSGILRALAEQIGVEANVIALSAVRTIPRGWVAMRDVLGFDGSAKELLSDVAASGGAVLFLDGVDFFEEPAQATAKDLIREAASIPGFKVVVTARRSFGTVEPSWLPSDALDKLGRAPVVIDELSDTEIAELRSAAPQLVPLLADGHSAREVVRNLFRLDRLVQLGGGAEAPRTETEMARLWWRTGDGRVDGARDRTRILLDLAEKSLSGQSGPFITSAYPIKPLEELVKSGTLRDLEGERMTFRHDVFRDWAVANLLHEHAAKISALPLSRPAPASLFRGIELAARFSIEGSEDAEAWISLLNRLSEPGIHGSWRRAAVVALVRSELSPEILTRAESALLAEHGRLLRELVRTLMSLDTKPASEIFGRVGVAVPEAIAHLSVPVGPAWRRLVQWMLAKAERLPGAAIPDVAELFTDYASAMWAIDPIIPDVVARLHAWLMEIEGHRIDERQTRRPLFGGGLDYDRQQDLHDYLRSSFLVFSGVKPLLAEQYVRFLLNAGRAAEHSAESVIKTPGDLAMAAPKALAELTATMLIEMPAHLRGGLGSYSEPEPFTWTDRQFLSPSPARGPFLKLLMANPTEGLALVRRLVMHACTFDSGHRASANNDAVVVELEAGPRRFPFIQSYFWSRDGRYYSVVSALMALEAWAHLRIDAGEDVGTIIADLLGDDEVPAAYLLVVVDLVLSHWPKSRKAAVPFAASPELLAWDRSRQMHDRMGEIGLFGEKEPTGPANRAGLRNRASRGRLLEEVLPYYAFGERAERHELRKRLKRAKARLAAYGPEADFGDPHFMVQVALNRIDRRNYQIRTVRDDKGKDQTVYAYVSPQDEADHLATMQSRAAPGIQDANLRAEVALALNDRSKQSVELARRAVEWAQGTQTRGEVQQDFDQSILITAVLLMRDGGDALRTKHGTWARAQFAAAANQAEDPVHRMRNGLQFNPLGLAAAGLVLAARQGSGLSDVRPLLELAVRGDPAAAHGFGTFLADLAAIDLRLPKAVLRCAFVGNIRPRLKHNDAKGDVDVARKRQITEWRNTALDAEWNWLQGNGPEPTWPDFPDAAPNARPRTYIRGAGPTNRQRPRAEAEYYADHQAVALWLAKIMGDQLIAPEWLRGVARHYRSWTSALNGAGHETELELSHPPSEWNSAYYRLVARSLSGLDAAATDALCLEPVTCLPDEPFLDVAADLLQSLDVVYFDDKGLAAADLLRIRTNLTERLRKTSQWRRFAANPGYGIPYHLDDALGAIFLCQHGFRSPPQCYVTAIGMPRAEPFVPLLTELAIATPSLFVMLAVLSAVSVSPDCHFVAYGVKATKACMAAYPNDTKLWVEYGAGKIFCSWLAEILRKGALVSIDQEGLRGAVEHILSDLIRLGVSDATAIERKFVGTALD